MAVALARVPGEPFACAELLSKNLADGAGAFLEGFRGATHLGQVRPVERERQVSPMAHRQDAQGQRTLKALFRSRLQLLRTGVDSV